MMEAQPKEIWTIGHSTRPIEEFVAMLQSFDIASVADVRQFPGSRKFPQFNKEELSLSLRESKIDYYHILKLGGRRKSNADSKNTAWRHPAFRAYADYMETSSFTEGIASLQDLASNNRVADMCSEALWWGCHRRLISDYLKAKGWTVNHIMGISKSEEHRYLPPASFVNGRLDYSSE